MLAPATHKLGVGVGEGGFTTIPKRNKMNIVNLFKSLCPQRPFVSFRLVVQYLGA